MSEPAGHRSGVPRFPYVTAAICAACVGAAIWLWLSYSYAWDVGPRELVGGKPPLWLGAWEGKYVRITGDVRPGRVPLPRDPHRLSIDVEIEVASGRRLPSGATWKSWDVLPGTLLHDPLDPAVKVVVIVIDEACQAGISSFRGRVFCGNVSIWRELWRDWPLELSPGLVIRTDSSRFTGASIAGLVVGAMGVFVFAVTLRHWLKQRRAAWPPAEA